MKVEKFDNRWSKLNCYYVRTYKELDTLRKWMYDNNVSYELLSAGSSGYVFEIRGDRDWWFQLRWL